MTFLQCLMGTVGTSLGHSSLLLSDVRHELLHKHATLSVKQYVTGKELEDFLKE